MGAFQIALRLLLNFGTSPTGRRIIGAAGRVILRQSQAAFIRAMRNGKRNFERETVK